MIAIYVECVCVKCANTFGRIEDSDIDCPRPRNYLEPFLCPDCISEEDEKKFREKESKRDWWLNRREELTVIERLKFIEEWIYDHKN